MCALHPLVPEPSDAASAAGATAARPAFPTASARSAFPAPARPSRPDFPTSRARRQAVLVLGMHRSGTSAMTRTLGLWGVDLGERFLPAAADNEAGFWEHRDLVLVNDQALAVLGRRWDDPRPIPPEAFLDLRLVPLREKALRILERDFGSSKLWGLKDPRLCRLLPFWRQVLAAFDCDPAYVHMLRSPADVARSLRVRNGFSKPHAERLWMAHVLEAERETRSSRRAFVTFDQLLADGPLQAERLGAELQLAIAPPASSAELVEEFLNPTLRHHHTSNEKTWFPETAIAWAALQSAADGHIQVLDPVLDPLREEQGKIEARSKLTSVSIVLVTRNGIEHTKRCLDSIARVTPEHHEIIVVDNGSSDGTVDYLQSRAASEPRLRLVLNRGNRGFAAANNVGFALAEGDVLVALNNDTIVTSGWLTRLVAVLDENPEVGIVGPRTNRASGPQVLAARYSTVDELEGFARDLAKKQAGESVEARRLVAFCWAMRRSLLERIGGFDESFGMGNCEDDDYCLRAAQAGYRARIVCDAFVHHVGSSTFSAEKVDYAALLQTNFEIFKKKWEMPAEARADQGYPFVELALKADRPKVALPNIEKGWERSMDGRVWIECVAAGREAGHQTSPAEVSEAPSTAGALLANPASGQVAAPPKSSPTLKVRVGVLPGEEAVPAARRFFEQHGFHAEIPSWSSVAEVGETLRTHDYVLILGADAHMTDAAFRALLEIARAHPKIGAIGPVSNAAPPEQRVAAKYHDLDADLRRFTEKRRKKYASVWHDVSCLGGFALLLSGVAARSVGGLRRDLSMPLALLEYAQRLRERGYRVACASGVYIHHSRLSEDEGARYEAAPVEPARRTSVIEASAAL